MSTHDRMQVYAVDGLSCPVMFCRKQCAILPKDAVVIRASGMMVCTICERLFYDHEMFWYPSGMGHAHRLCDGTFVHL